MGNLGLIINDIGYIIPRAAGTVDAAAITLRCINNPGALIRPQLTIEEVRAKADALVIINTKDEIIDFQALDPFDAEDELPRDLEELDADPRVLKFEGFKEFIDRALELEVFKCKGDAYSTYYYI